jgi:hypothetical protein
VGRLYVRTHPVEHGYKTIYPVGIDPSRVCSRGSALKRFKKKAVPVYQQQGVVFHGRPPAKLFQKKQMGRNMFLPLL